MMMKRLLQVRSKHTLPSLPYDYNALEPVISGNTNYPTKSTNSIRVAEIMQLHHAKHHQAYVNNLNVAESKMHDAEQKQDLAAMIQLQSALKFNGGGHLNHSIFWTNLAPTGKGGGDAPKGNLATAINREFGSLEKMISTFNANTAAVQGSGWGWLVSVSMCEYIFMSGWVGLQPHDKVAGVDHHGKLGPGHLARSRSTVCSHSIHPDVSRQRPNE